MQMEAPSTTPACLCGSSCECTGLCPRGFPSVRVQSSYYKQHTKSPSREKPYLVVCNRTATNHRDLDPVHCLLCVSHCRSYYGRISITCDTGASKSHVTLFLLSWSNVSRELSASYQPLSHVCHGVSIPNSDLTQKRNACFKTCDRNSSQKRLQPSHSSSLLRRLRIRGYAAQQRTATLCLLFLCDCYHFLSGYISVPPLESGRSGRMHVRRRLRLWFPLSARRELGK